MSQESLAHKVQVGAMFREWMSHPAFKIWEKDLQNKIEDVKKDWITCDDPVKAERIRMRAQNLNEALDIAKKHLLAGEIASKALQSDLEVQNQGL